MRRTSSSAEVVGEGKVVGVKDVVMDVVVVVLVVVVVVGGVVTARVVVGVGVAGVVLVGDFVDNGDLR